MLTLTGIVRQTVNLTFKDRDTGKEKPMRKLWVEHENPRESGPPDLKIIEFLIPAEQCPQVVHDSIISILVRPYAVGRNVAFSPLRVFPGMDPYSSPFRAAKTPSDA